VVAELLKRGWIAALAPRNAPDFDILVTNEEKTIKIRVKTKTEGYDIWQWSVKQDGKIFKSIIELEDFTVLVNMTDDHKEMDYFIIPTHLINRWLIHVFDLWVKTPGVGGRPHSPTNKKRILPYRDFEEQLSNYKNNWKILWD
jgi:hypothetical protein